MNVKISNVARKIFILCILVEVLLLAADILFNYLDIFNELYIRRIWNIARELSIPSWFSSTQTQLMGLTVLLIGVVQKSLDKNVLHPRPYISWVIAGVFFIWIGIDDAAEIHEKLGTAISNINNSGTEQVHQHLSFSWHTYLAPIFILFGLYLTYFFWREMSPHQLFRYVFIGFGCWVTSQIIDFGEGLADINDMYTAIQTYLGSSSTYLVPHSFKVVEEMLEMVGTTFLWVGFLHYLGIKLEGKQVQFKGAA